MHSKLVLYVLALLTGLAVGPQASVAADKAQAIEQCAASSGADAGPSAWFADMGIDGETKPIAAAPKATVAFPRSEKADCTFDTPISRKDEQRK